METLVLDNLLVRMALELVLRGDECGRQPRVGLVFAMRHGGGTLFNVANVAKVACATGDDLGVHAFLACHGTCVRWPVLNGAWRLGMFSRDTARRWGALFVAVGWGAGGNGASRGHLQRVSWPCKRRRGSGP